MQKSLLQRDLPLVNAAARTATSPEQGRDWLDVACSHERIVLPSSKSLSCFLRSIETNPDSAHAVVGLKSEAAGTRVFMLPAQSRSRMRATGQGSSTDDLL